MSALDSSPKFQSSYSESEASNHEVEHKVVEPTPMKFGTCPTT
jgi:hypothetical protein